MRTPWIAAICLVLPVTISGLALPASAQTPALADLPEARVSNFSDKVVPRFEMLEDPVANGRKGPGTDFPITWVYQRQNLPLLVIKETKEWWRVRDHDGDEVWMHQNLFIHSDRMMILSGTDMMQKPEPESVVTAHLEAGVIAESLDVRDSWVKLRADQYTGWVPIAKVWGHLPEAEAAPNP